MTQPRIIEADAAGVSNADICAFYATHWARPIALSRPDFLHWQMNAAPGAKGSNHSVVALEGDRIIAVMGVTPATFRHLRQDCAGAELTTWVVAPDARGKGVGKAILQHLQGRYAILTGAGITGAALPLYLGAGFTHLAQMPRFFFIADFAKAQAFANIPDPAQAVTARRQSQAVPQLWRAVAVPAAALAPAAASLSPCGHFRRDAARLAWRHDSHAAFRYEAFTVRDPGQTGNGSGVVLREDTVQQTPILHVIDLFGPPRHLRAALAFIEDEARRRGAAFVDISLTAGPLIAHLRARGWSSAVDDPLIELPSLFYPVELRRPPTTSLILWGGDTQQRLYDFSRLHITRADMDLDRPTLAWYDQHPT
ncbi:MAG: GNAT family N-acetyltransferase [Rhodobacteraceae bacterium]|nr:GNAT family N-acetyltransferase [Paracoccaceae bacterium]